MRIPPLLSDILLVLRWTLIHLAIFGFCSYTSMDNAYEEGWPDYRLIASILQYPLCLLQPFSRSLQLSLGIIVANSLVWGLASLVLRRLSRLPSCERPLESMGILFFVGGLYAFLLRVLIYMLGKGLPVQHRDEILLSNPLIQILGFPTVQISTWLEIPLRLPLTFAIGVVIGGFALAMWRWRSRS